MSNVLPMPQLLRRFRWLPGLVIGLTLAVLAGVILLARQQLRGEIREQIVGRDGEILQAVALMHELEEAAADSEASPDDPASQLVVVLKTSRLRGVMGARLFGANGKFVEAFRENVREAELSPGDLAALRTLKSVSHFHPAVPLDEIFLPETTNDLALVRTAPVLEVNVPLAGGTNRLAGVAQFIIEGGSIAAEFAALDRHLNLQALAAFGAGGGILVLVMGYAFRRLRHAHQQLTERTANLLQANQELALAAKTSAVGAVTAHLIHGLKNPLFGLQSFVANLNANGADQSPGEWQQAVGATRRMQSMIDQIVSVLREEQDGGRYEITLNELDEMIDARVQPLARERRVTFTTDRETNVVFANRTANLVTLILVNLIQNALEATPHGRSVRLIYRRVAERLECTVRDQGPGLPEQALKTLFTATATDKAGGSGIGLAISKQLANHLGAPLELQSSGADGCVFALSLPAALWANEVAD